MPAEGMGSKRLHARVRDHLQMTTFSPTAEYRAEVCSAVTRWLSSYAGRGLIHTP